MRRPGTFAAVALACPALAACGGSSSVSTTSTSPADQSAARAVAPRGAGKSTPVASPAYRKLITTAAAEKGLSPQVAAKVADCLIKKEQAQGFRTVGDIAKDAATRQQAVQDGAECTVQAMPAG